MRNVIEIESALRRHDIAASTQVSGKLSGLCLLLNPFSNMVWWHRHYIASFQPLFRFCTFLAEFMIVAEMTHPDGAIWVWRCLPTRIAEARQYVLKTVAVGSIIVAVELIIVAVEFIIVAVEESTG